MWILRSYDVSCLSLARTIVKARNDNARSNNVEAVILQPKQSALPPEELSSSNVLKLDEGSACNRALDSEARVALSLTSHTVYQEVPECYGLDECKTKQ
ncbi:hypothetical protein EVAR_13221_1 [Eumeta japonica]|uniref:Uncharacterized protein n=1 Tax=Eumeta variegata TaxID=151549 RepID=A0A4C1TS60_EUMVA|nr:hypothetical protein EVAR_13221_1 [Eumeta japonica]